MSGTSIPTPLTPCESGCDCKAVLKSYVTTLPYVPDDDSELLYSHRSPASVAADEELAESIEPFIEWLSPAVRCTLRKANEINDFPGVDDHENDEDEQESREPSVSNAALTPDNAETKTEARNTKSPPKQAPIPWSETLEATLFSLFTIHVHLSAKAAPGAARLFDRDLTSILAALEATPGALLAAAEQAYLGARSVTSRQPLSPAFPAASDVPPALLSTLTLLRTASTLVHAATRLDTALRCADASGLRAAAAAAHRRLAAAPPAAAPRHTDAFLQNLPPQGLATLAACRAAAIPGGNGGGTVVGASRRARAAAAAASAFASAAERGGAQGLLEAGSAILSSNSSSSSSVETASAQQQQQQPPHVALLAAICRSPSSGFSSGSSSGANRGEREGEGDVLARLQAGTLSEAAAEAMTMRLVAARVAVEDAYTVAEAVRCRYSAPNHGCCAC
jgi:hypothetical protein